MHIIRNKIKQNFQISMYIYIYIFNVAHHHQNIINILKRFNFNSYKAKNKFFSFPKQHCLFRW